MNKKSPNRMFLLYSYHWNKILLYVSVFYLALTGIET